MKLERHPLKPAILLLLLLGLSLGGWGVFSAAYPELAPAWMSGLLEIIGIEGKDAKVPTADGAPDSISKSADPENLIPGSGNSSALRIYDPKALPKGLTSIDGEGGSGVNRVVKKNGVWFPVYSPGPRPGGGPPPLTVIPLSIASGSPPPGRVHQTFLYQAEAIGGTPPYQWKAGLPAPAGTFNMGPADGLLTGLSREPLTLTLDLTVTDAAGAVDTASMKLVVRPEKDLAIETAELPAFKPTEPASAELHAGGGVPPYRWSLTGQLPEGLSLQPDTGRIEGSTSQAGDFPLPVTVTDSQETRVEKVLTLRCHEGLDITTPEALPPAAPGAAYELSFEATGGVAPYTWEISGGFLPDSSWKLSDTGLLTGQGGSTEQFVEFTLTVSDSTEATFEKSFRLAVGDLLILVPSREKVGVAWSPAAVSGLLAAGGLSATGFQVLRDGIPVYEGGGSNFVDRGLRPGSIPRYTLMALTNDEGRQSVSEKETAVLPQILTRAEPGRNGDPYADRVVSFQPLSPGGYGSASLPRNVTGPPDGHSIYAPANKPGEVLSLHARPGAGGLVELEFTDNIVEILPGEDLTVFENVLYVGGNANQRFMEPAVVSVALFPGEWHRVSCDAVPPIDGQPLDLRDPFYYARGFAGRNGTTGSDPTNPNASGGDSLDLDEAAARAGLTWIRYIKIQSTGDAALRDDAGGDLIRHPDDPAFNPLSGSGSSGFDLDAVSAVHY